MTLNDILNLVVVCAVVLFVLGFGIYMLAGKGEAIISGYGGRAKGEPPKYNAKNLSRLIGLVLILLDLIVTATALLSSLQIAPWATAAGGIARGRHCRVYTRLRQCEQEDTPALKPIRAESMKRAPEFPEPFSGVYSGARRLMRVHMSGTEVLRTAARIFAVAGEPFRAHPTFTECCSRSRSR